MKKLKLNLSRLQGSRIMSRKELKNVLGGVLPDTTNALCKCKDSVQVGIATCALCDTYCSTRGGVESCT